MQTPPANPRSSSAGDGTLSFDSDGAASGSPLVASVEGGAGVAAARDIETVGTVT